MARLESSEILLKLALDELGIVRDWKKVNYNLVKRVLEDLYRKEIIDFGYRMCPSMESERMSGEVISSISNIADVVATQSFPDVELQPSFKTELESYKHSKSYISLFKNRKN